MVREANQVPVSKLPSSVVRKIKKGESVAVTSHGDQVAVIQPNADPTKRKDLGEFLENWRKDAPNLSDDPFGDLGDLRHRR